VTEEQNGLYAEATTEQPLAWRERSDPINAAP
jgi:hypothetical protein